MNNFKRIKKQISLGYVEEKFKRHVGESSYQFVTCMFKKLLREKIKNIHSNVIKLGLKLIIESDVRFNHKSGLTAEWSDIGTEGTSTIVKAIELANRYDTKEKIQILGYFIHWCICF